MLKLITPPPIEPISATDARIHARIEHTADDALLGAMIVAARAEAEHETGVRCVSQTLEQVLDGFSDRMDLDVKPVRAIVSVKYLDSDGVEQTLDPAVYKLIENALPPRVVLKSGQSWPSTYAADDAVRIRFIAGLAEAAVASAVTVGVTTTVVLAANPGSLAAGGLLRLDGFSGADAALLNGLDHTVNSVSGTGPYTFVLATNTAGKTITLGQGAGLDAAAMKRESALTAWISVRVASLYAQREAFVAGLSVAEMPGRFIAGLLDPYRIPRAG